MHYFTGFGYLTKALGLWSAYQAQTNWSESKQNGFSRLEFARGHPTDMYTRGYGCCKYVLKASIRAVELWVNFYHLYCQVGYQATHLACSAYLHQAAWVVDLL